jgi:poly-gamma-glutamate capsule biosynthesis protein CapA/YwtB (metallophosphatase superfamily)
MKRFFIVLPLLFFLFVPDLAFSEAGSTVRIVFLGDFLPAGSAEPIIRSRGYGHLFDGVRSILQSADAVVLNLETPISARGKALKGKGYTFRSPPEVAEAIAREGIKAVWLANNHIMDFGIDALNDTIVHLEAAGIAHAGAGGNVAAAAAPATLTFEGPMIALLSFSNTFPDSYWARRDRPGTFFGAPGSVERAVERTCSDRTAVVASFHWGAELMTEPKEYQVDLARKAIDHGASLVVGHHPHVPQPVEIYRGTPILYSLGNFAFGSYSKRTPYGLMAIAEFDESGRCTYLEVYPLHTDNSKVVFSPRPVTGLEGQSIFDRLVKAIDPSEASVVWDGEKGVVVPKQTLKSEQ